MIKFSGVRIFFVLALFTLLLYSFSYKDPFATNIFLGLFSIVPLLFIFRSSKVIDFFEPPFILILFYLLGVIYRIFAISMDTKAATELYFLTGSRNIDSGIILILVFNFFFALAYSFKVKGVRFPSISLPLKNNKAYKRILIAFLILLALYLIHSFFAHYNTYSQILSGNFSSKKLFNEDGERDVQGYLRLGEELFNSLFIVTYTKFLGGRKSLKYFWILSGSIVIIFNIFTNSRVAVFNIFFIGMLIRSFYMKRIISPKVLAIAVTFVIFITGMTGLRQTGSIVSFNFQDSLFGVNDQLSRGTYAISVDKAEIVTARVPSHAPFMRGETFLATLYAPIPRSIWPDKPIIRSGPFFAQKVYLSNRENTGIPASFPVEAYWNFGWIGLAVCAAILGILSRTQYNKAFKLRKGKLSISASQTNGTISRSSSQKPRVSLTSQARGAAAKHFENSVVKYALFINMFFFPLILGDFAAATVSYIQGGFLTYIFMELFKADTYGH